MASTEAGKVVVKLVLDATEFYAALERVKEALRDLGDTPVRLRIENALGEEPIVTRSHAPESIAPSIIAPRRTL